MDALFVGMISRLDSMSDLLSIFEIFGVFWTPFWGVFWDKYVKQWGMEKESKKESQKSHAGCTQAGRSAAEAGASGGGGGFTSELCKLVLPSSVQHALLPLTRCGGSQSPASSSGRGD